MSNMTPREIVHDLDKHIIGQDDAKRAVAIALRNRWRRMQLDEELRAEIASHIDWARERNIPFTSSADLDNEASLLNMANIMVNSGMLTRYDEGPEMVYAIKAEQHYIQIWSDQGSDLVRFKFSDLPVTLADCNGVQVHAIAKPS